MRELWRPSGSEAPRAEGRLEDGWAGEDPGLVLLGPSSWGCWASSLEAVSQKGKTLGFTNVSVNKDLASLRWLAD